MDMPSQLSFDGLAINAFTLNRDASLCIVAGGKILKCIRTSEKGFSTDNILCLRGAGKRALNLNTTDVCFNPLDNHMFASASVNGKVLLWNVGQKHQQYFDRHVIEKAHDRTTNRVRFSSSGHLLSCSQDGRIISRDCRFPDSPMAVYHASFTGAESVRDIQWSPLNEYHFVAALESGEIQLWDSRRNNMPFLKFRGHYDPCFTVDFHPKLQLLATGSRDKSIRIWDLSDSSDARQIHVIPTIASVARVKWRPDCDFHIASCSLVVPDFSVYVWEIRRPFVPFAQIDSHKNVVSDVHWYPNNSNILFTSGKDGVLCMHNFSDFKRPVDSITPSVLDLGTSGVISHAVLKKPEKTNSSKNYSFWGQAIKSGKEDEFAEQKESSLQVFSSLNFDPALQEAYMYTGLWSQNLTGEWFMFLIVLPIMLWSRNDKMFSMDDFEFAAQKYSLTGASFDSICEHNAAVAGQLGNYKVKQIWLLVKQLFGGKTRHESSDRTAAASNSAAQTSPRSPKASIRSGDSATKLTSVDSEKGAVSDRKRSDRFEIDGVPLLNENSADSANEEIPTSEDTEVNQVSSNSEQQDADFFFGDKQPVYFDGDDDADDFEDAEQTEVYFDENTITSGGFQARPDLPTHNDQSELSDGAVKAGDGADIIFKLPDVIPTEETSGFPNEMNHRIRQGSENEDFTTFSSPPRLQAKQTDSRGINFMPFIKDLLLNLVNEGDIQTAVSILLVAGGSISSHIPVEQQYEWLSAYIDLLSRFKLFNTAIEVTRLCRISDVSSRNSLSTTVNVNCMRCNRMLPQGWFCMKCRRATNFCSICRLPVRGIFVWCRGCGHGGHIDHMKQWFDENGAATCPAGCGHVCQFM